MSEVVQVFSNRHAGRHCRREVAALAEALQARGATVLLSESEHGTPRIAQEATHVCVVGGDGQSDTSPMPCCARRVLSR